jgi:hypothetical protein
MIEIEYIINFISSPWGTFLLTILTLVVVLAYSYIADRSVAIILILILILATFSRLEIKEEYRENNEILKAFIEGQNLDDLITKRELSNVEATAKSIWVFTRNLSNGTGISNSNNQNNEIFKAIEEKLAISDNLKEKKKYTYFIPDEPSKYGAIEEFKKLHKFSDDQVEFCLIPAKEFHIVSEIVIYDKKYAMQWFPNKKINYYIRLGDTYTMGIIDSAELLLNKYLKKNKE